MVSKLEILGIDLGKIALGVEHFARLAENQNLEGEMKTREILKKAIELGITHYDLVFNLPYFLDIFGSVFAGRRKSITFSTHLGTVFNEKTGKVRATRSLKPIQATFTDALNRLQTDYADIGMIQYVKHDKDYDDITRKNGLLSYVSTLKEIGQIKAIGVSSHDYSLLQRVVDNHEIDVLMTIINFATGHSENLRNLIKKCKEQDITIIAIKTLLKGKVLSLRKEKYGAYYSGGKRFSLKLLEAATAKDCFDYAHQMGADNVVFGVKNVNQLIENHKSYYNAERNVDTIINQFKNL